MEHWGLFTDYYELTMAAAFHAEGRGELATFELFVRSPAARGGISWWPAGSPRRSSGSAASRYDADDAGLPGGTAGPVRRRLPRLAGVIPLHGRGAGHGRGRAGSSPTSRSCRSRRRWSKPRLSRRCCSTPSGFETMIASKAARVAAGGRRPNVRRLLGPARPRRRCGAAGGPSRPTWAAPRARRWSKPAGATASRSQARWPTRT